jgi:RarD protein
VVDEAFADAIPDEPQSLAALDLPDVVVLRSLTKTWSLAGLRVGYALGAPEVLAHRVIWTVVLMAIVLTIIGRLGDLRAISGRTWLLLTCASALISTNWLIYIVAVNSDHVVDAALGYFITPLVSVVLGVMNPFSNAPLEQFLICQVLCLFVPYWSFVR